MADFLPRLLVYSSLFPSAVQPGAGLFIRERMFRVGKELPIVVVAPVAWFPLQGIIRVFRPNYRPMPPRQETQDGVEVFHPRFFAIPGMFRQLDGLFMALGSLRTLMRLRQAPGYDIIDAHFAYPDGYAATLLGRWLDVPVTITLRGTEIRHAAIPSVRKRLTAALKSATKIFSVSDSLKQHAISLGTEVDKVLVVGNGVDTEKFSPVDRMVARKKLGLADDARVLISVGGLVERKGFHRVIDCLPELLKEFPHLIYLIVGGPSGEGDWSQRLRDQVTSLNLHSHVLFLGTLSPSELKWPLSAADVFVLATRNEGWANVFLEAMACGLPVIATDVGGNREVVANDALGSIVPFGDAIALRNTLQDALQKTWDREKIIAYARGNSWHSRVAVLTAQFGEMVRRAV